MTETHSRKGNNMIRLPSILLHKSKKTYRDTVTSVSKNEYEK